MDCKILARLFPSPGGVSPTKVLAMQGLRLGREMDTHQFLHRACELSPSSAGYVVQIIIS